MAITLQGAFDPGINWEAQSVGDEQKTSDGFTKSTDAGSLTNKRVWQSGTGSGQNNKIYRARRTLTVATGTDDLDLTNGSLKDPFGTALVFTAVKFVAIANIGKEGTDGSFSITDGEDLLVGGAGAAADAWSAPFNGDQDAVIVLDSGDSLFLSKNLTGFTVSAGTSDVLRIAHSGTDDITYDIALIGV